MPMHGIPEKLSEQFKEVDFLALTAMWIINLPPKSSKMLH